MPRPPRLDYPSARHHVMNRGARRSPVFADDISYGMFLSLLGEFPERLSLSAEGPGDGPGRDAPGLGGRSVGRGPGFGTRRRLPPARARVAAEQEILHRPARVRCLPGDRPKPRPAHDRASRAPVQRGTLGTGLVADETIDDWMIALELEAGESDR